MTDTQLNAELLARRARLATEASLQALELRARQLSGQQHVGPWAPAARLAKPRRPKLQVAQVVQVQQWRRVRA